MAIVTGLCFAALIAAFATVDGQLPPVSLPSIPPVSGLPSGQSPTTRNPNAVYRKRVYDVHIYARLVKGLREVNDLLKQFPVLGPLAGQLLGPIGILGGGGGAGSLLGGSGGPLGGGLGAVSGLLGGLGGGR
uniref:Uncharacterized protein n=1 Tax=Romanomermis culicivorax TaxID=13658 RepID=A0A915HXL8_ROMCU